MEKLFEYLKEHEDLPDELSIEKIMDRGYDFREVGDDKIQFTIVRHPGFAGMHSGGRGIGIPMMWDQITEYTVDLNENSWSIELLEESLDYDASLMATTAVNDLEEGGFFDDCRREGLSKEETIEKAVNREVDYLNMMRENEAEKISDEVWNRMISEYKTELSKEASEFYEIKFS